MLKVEHKPVEPPMPSRPISSIPIGTTFTSTFYDNISRLFLKTYEGLVMLDNPNKTWNNDCAVSLKNYKEVNVICKVE